MSASLPVQIKPDSRESEQRETVNETLKIKKKREEEK